MNKRIFILVCNVLYGLLAVSIHCSEQKTSGLRSRIVRAIKKINKGVKKSGIESKHETQLNNKNNSDPKDDEGYNDKICNLKYYNDDVDDKDVKGNKSSDYDGQWKPHGYWFFCGSNNMVTGYGMRPKF
ncbi:fam-c protein [Plasmodium vinckei vinckei]|uniref:Fam-c protein n=1 Tax=Plasmodium vinckei vinckei TaxID=54757 RepID=A0A449BVU7_PLAVN|nr:fam-c protein [Plasmodium vinckei vinckei]KEG03321.1 hypothetical protein YYE_01345 [Plasmodium vinckei vinckei]VEV57610.1 fam-c protein [Plasmodium vinckei vinckei]